MSFRHSIAFGYLMKHKCTYDPNQPPDYATRQSKEQKRRGAHIPHGVKIEQISLDGISGEKLSASNNPENKVILYIHGGGFVSGTAKGRRDTALYLVRHTRYNVISIDYRLAPSNPFPAAPDDCFVAYQALEKQYGGKNIALMGESAGGNLVLSVALQAKDNNISIPACVVAVSPAVQHDQSLPSYQKNKSTDCILDEIGPEAKDAYFQSEDLAVLRNPYASPIYGDLRSFPPTYLIASDSEVLLDDSVIFHKKLLEAGCESHLDLYPGMMHAFAVMMFLPEAKMALNNMNPFLYEKLG